MGSNNSRSARSTEPDALTREQSRRSKERGAPRASKKSKAKAVASSQTEDQLTLLSDLSTESPRQGALDEEFVNEETPNVPELVSSPSDAPRGGQMLPTQSGRHDLLDNASRSNDMRTPVKLTSQVEQTLLGVQEHVLKLYTRLDGLFDARDRPPYHFEVETHERACRRHAKIINVADYIMRQKGLETHPLLSIEYQLLKTLGTMCMNQGRPETAASADILRKLNVELLMFIERIHEFQE